jgi:cation transporter-like permease
MSKRAATLLFIIFSVGIASSISLIGGLGIEAVEDRLLRIVPLLIALPGLNSMVGDYATLIAAHAGDPEERSRSKRELALAMAPSVLINIGFILLVSLPLSYYRGFDLDTLFLIKFIGFVASSIITVIAIMFLITLALDAALKHRSLNPDDVLIPIVTTISDIFMLGLIALAALLLF